MSNLFATKDLTPKETRDVLRNSLVHFRGLNQVRQPESAPSEERLHTLMVRIKEEGNEDETLAAYRTLYDDALSASSERRAQIMGFLNSKLASLEDLLPKAK